MTDYDIIIAGAGLALVGITKITTGVAMGVYAIAAAVKSSVVDSVVLAGIIKACQKRPVDSVAIANAVENTVLNSLKSEITSVEIGELIMSELIKADAVAYIRFVSVYRDFNDVESFMKELKKFL